MAKARSQYATVNVLPRLKLVPLGGDVRVEWAGRSIGWVRKTRSTSGSATTWAYVTWDNERADGMSTRVFALQSLFNVVQSRVEDEERRHKRRKQTRKKGSR